MPSSSAVDTSNPAVLLQSAVIPLESWTQVLDISAHFDLSKPLEVDVGAGKGRFLLSRAASHPDTNFIGIERLLERIRKMDRKIQRNGLNNTRLIRAEASYALQYLLPRTSVSTLYFFFPDPWPKRRHHRRRLFNTTGFFDTLRRVLLPGGKIHVATDHTDYCTEIRRRFAEQSDFHEIPAFQPTEDERTDFELIFTGQGFETNRCSYVLGR